MHLHELPSPDTAAAVAANQVARRYCSSALYAHSVRSYLWGVAYAHDADLEVDLELLYVAAMLHDLGLTRPFDAHEIPFEEAGGQVAWVFAAAAGWPDVRRIRVAEVIERHMWPAVDRVEVHPGGQRDPAFVEGAEDKRERVIGPVGHIGVDVEGTVGRCQTVETDQR